MLDKVKAKHPKIHTIQSDVADPAQIDALAARVKAEFPRLDVLMNNAGIMLYKNLRASAADLAQFTLLTRSAARDALDAMSGQLERLEGPDGSVLFDVPGAPLPGEDTPCPPRLMAMWDSILLAYADRSRVIPPAYRPLVIRRNGDVLPTLLVDGHVAGVWRPAGGCIEATAFRELPERAWQELAEEARALVSFLAARDPAVYRRFAHWWKELPAAEVRLLPA